MSAYQFPEIAIIDQTRGYGRSVPEKWAHCAKELGRTVSAVKMISHKLSVLKKLDSLEACETNLKKWGYGETTRTSILSYLDTKMFSQKDPNSLPPSVGSVSLSESPNQLKEKTETPHFLDTAIESFIQNLTDGFSDYTKSYQEMRQKILGYEETIGRLSRENQSLKEEINKRPMAQKLSHLLDQWGR